MSIQASNQTAPIVARPTAPPIHRQGATRPMPPLPTIRSEDGAISAATVSLGRRILSAAGAFCGRLPGASVVIAAWDVVSATMARFAEASKIWWGSKRRRKEIEAALLAAQAEVTGIAKRAEYALGARQGLRAVVSSLSQEASSAQALVGTVTITEGGSGSVRASGAAQRYQDAVVRLRALSVVPSPL